MYLKYGVIKHHVILNREFASELMLSFVIYVYIYTYMYVILNYYIQLNIDFMLSLTCSHDLWNT